MTKAIEYLFIYLLAICIFFWAVYAIHLPSYWLDNIFLGLNIWVLEYVCLYVYFVSQGIVEIV